MKWMPIVIFFLILNGCDFPADPNNTLLKIQKNHILLVGTCTDYKNNDNKIAAEIIEDIAKKLNAQIKLEFDTQENLYHKLERFELDIIFCSIQTSSPWHKQVAFTIPYKQSSHTDKQSSFVFALPPGENSWLKYVNDFIFEKNQTDN